MSRGAPVLTHGLTRYVSLEGCEFKAAARATSLTKHAHDVVALQVLLCYIAWVLHAFVGGRFVNTGLLRVLRLPSRHSKGTAMLHWIYIV
jgi:hypothetical protein